MAEKIESQIVVSDWITVGYLGGDDETAEMTPESFRVLLTFSDKAYSMTSYEAQAVARYLNKLADEAQMAERGWRATHAE